MKKYQIVKDLADLNSGILGTWLAKTPAFVSGEKLWKSGKYDNLFLISWDDNRMTTEHSWYKWNTVKPKINYGYNNIVEPDLLIYAVEIGDDYESGEIKLVTRYLDKAIAFAENLWCTIDDDWMTIRSYVVGNEKPDETLIRSWSVDGQEKRGEDCECNACKDREKTVMVGGYCTKCKYYKSGECPAGLHKCLVVSGEVSEICEDSKVSGPSCGYCGLNCYGPNCTSFASRSCPTYGPNPSRTKAHMAKISTRQ